jgi:hypothetical protein
VVVALVIRRYLLTPGAAGIVRSIPLTTSALVLAVGIKLVAPDGNFPGVLSWQLALAPLTATVGRARVHPGLLVLGGASGGIGGGLGR